MTLIVFYESRCKAKFCTFVDFELVKISPDFIKLYQVAGRCNSRQVHLSPFLYRLAELRPNEERNTIISQVRTRGTLLPPPF